MRTFITVFAFILIGFSVAAAQEPPPTGQPLRVFLDCSACDFDLIRTEVPYVDYVRDRKDADLHALVTSQRNSSGGQDYVIEYIGLGRFTGQKRTLRYSSSGSDTSDERRRGLARTLALGLVPFLYDTPAARYLSVTFEPTAVPPTSATASDDPWNLWVFRASSSVNLNGESRGNQRGIRANLSANRTTDLWKLSASSNVQYDENEFKLSDGSEFTSISKNWGARVLAIRGLGSDHWAAAVRASAGASTFENRDLAVRAAAGLEYSVFPYAESTRRVLYAQYTIGVNRLTYYERTIFDKLEETVYDQNVETSLSLRQPWGFARLSFEASNYLHDFSKHRLAMNGRMDVRVFRGFSLNINGNASRVRDQLYLPAGGASDEEILLRLRRLQTSFRYGLSMGFSYQFGSIFNNVVNPRFEGF